MEYQTKCEQVILTKEMFSKNFFNRDNEVYFTLTDEGTIMVNHYADYEYREFADIEILKDDNGEYVYFIDVFSCNCAYSLDKDSDDELYFANSLEEAILIITKGLYCNVCDHIAYLSSFKEALESIQ